MESEGPKQARVPLKLALRVVLSPGSKDRADFEIAENLG